MRYRDLFREREFAALYVADVLSMSGSYIAKVAVAALVYARTGSTADTAIAFAIGFAPYLFGPWLSSLADLFPRRRLLVACDLARAAAVGGVVIPGMPIWAIVVLLFLESAFRVPWGAARLALLADVLPGSRFSAGNALVGSTRQALQVAGFAVGGVVVALLGARQSLIIDMASFVASALILWRAVRWRPAAWRAAAAPDEERVRTRPTTWASTMLGIRTVTGSPLMRHRMFLLGFGPALAVISEGLAVPFADELSGGVRLAGLIMAAPPLGTVLGLWYVGRLDLPVQQRLVNPFVVMTSVSVVLVGLVGTDRVRAALGATASATAVVVLLVVVGVSLCYLNAIQSEIAAEVPQELRGRVFGIANAVLQVFQGIAIAIGGILASSTSVAPALMAIAIVGTVVLVVFLGLAGRRTASDSPRLDSALNH